MRATTVLSAFAVLTALTVLPNSADAAPVTCAGLRATRVGTNGDDTITGTRRRDVIQARGGHDRVRGIGGNDVLCGGAGRDVVAGGGGDDRVYGGLDQIWNDPGHGTARTGDTLSGGPGDDLLDPGIDTRPVDEIDQPDTITFAGATRGVRLDIPDRQATGQGSDSITRGFVEWVLTRHADHVIGGDGPNWVRTGAGHDVVFAGAGDDRIEVDDGTNIGTGGNDFVRGGPGDDVVGSGAGVDEVWAGSGNDGVIDGSPGVDRFRLESGNDVLIDTPAAAPGQVMAGGPGHDQWSLYNGPEVPGTWNMATGTFTLNGAAAGAATGWESASLPRGGWEVWGTEGADDISTGSATDFHALGGDDTFSGSLFDDRFDGGMGNDTAMTMSDGDDTCISVEDLRDATCETVTP